MGMKVRNLRLSSGATTSFRFAEEEWKAIERVAEGHGLRWTEWARNLIQANPDAPSRSGLLRRSALEEAYGQALLAERAELMSEGRDLDHPMLTGRFWPLSGDALDAELQMLVVDYRTDFQSFELIAGKRDFAPVLIVRNKLEGALSFLLSRDLIEDGGDGDEILDNLNEGEA